MKTYISDIYERDFYKVKKSLEKEINTQYLNLYTGNHIDPSQSLHFEHIVSMDDFLCLYNAAILSPETQSRILNHRKNIKCNVITPEKNTSRFSIVNWVLKKLERKNAIITPEKKGNVLYNEWKLRNDTLDFMETEIQKEITILSN